MPKPKKKMTAAQKAAARVPEMPPAPVEEPAEAAPKAKVPLSAQEKRSRRRVLVVGLVVLVLLSFVLYTCNYSHATDEARASLSTTQELAVSDTSEWIAFGDASADVGYVFYPGGKVEAESYAPLLRQLAQRGVFCVLVKVPFNLAFFDVDAADGVLEAFPQVKTWYAGGHSLGGVAACQWTSAHADKVAGVILLASYTSVDLSGTDLRMLTVYGTADGVMNRDNLAESRPLCPADARDVVIEGGNHAQFGDYGTQDGDGTATISAADQRTQTVDAILDWISQ